MLGRRILTALLLLPIVIWGVLYASSHVFVALCLCILLLSAIEWPRLIGFKHKLPTIVFILLLMGSYFVASTVPVISIFSIALICWLINLFFICHYPHLSDVWAKPYVIASVAIIVMIAAMIALITIRRDYSPAMLMYLLLVVWVADIGAYFTGQAWGEHKLAPQVSPGKSIEGATGGVILVCLVAVSAAIYFKIDKPLWPQWIALAIVVALISIVGDLSISMFKRKKNLKDSGHLLPGHGGVLDRIDSLIAATPMFALGLKLLPWPMGSINL